MLLSGKQGLIFGVANDHSIAWGIAQALHAEGATLGFSYAVPALERRVRPLARSLRAEFVEPCDVTRDADIATLFEKARQAFGTLDFLVHSVAFANRDDLNRPYLDTSREGFHLALDISAYSLTALVRAAAPLMNPGGSVLTLTFHGSRQVMPHYNVMGVAKAALEASVRYLACDLGPRHIRVNAISPGPIRTLASAGVTGFKTLFRTFEDIAPLRRRVTIEDVGKTAVWLCSDLSGAVTGEVVYVDGGFNILGIRLPEPVKEA
ncbi:MAG TPA: enoyl-ACP reductase [Anaerolineae bacterium]|nr:enoyl-ACP reductase [Anaerolineae bacterium]